MRFSVIIPAYNAAATIGDALQSVLDQTYPPHEVIIVDDGSEDNTLEVASAYEELPLLLLHQENSGLGNARNAAMEVAAGDAWVFLDADDAWLPGKLAAAKKAVEQHPQTLWWYTPIYEWSDQGLRKRSCPEIRTVQDFIAYNPIVPSTVVMRTSLDFRWEEDRNLQEDVGAYLGLFHRQIFPKRIPEIGTMYRLDHGMTQQLEAHYDKVFAAVGKAHAQGHITDALAALYRVRKAYEAIRTYKKRGDQTSANHWRSELQKAATTARIPLGLRLRIALYT
jgi:glycosyltransferase involved in cell wall biosynthesis